MHIIINRGTDVQELFRIIGDRFDTIGEQIGLINRHLEIIDTRLDRIEGEVRLQRQALEQFGLMNKPQPTA